MMLRTIMSLHLRLKNDNHRVVDIAKVAYTHFYYTNIEDTLHLKTKPKYPTVAGSTFDTHAYAIPWLLEYPLETNLERAFRLGILDIWTPCCVVQLTNSHSLRYTGPKAIAIDKAFRAKVFKTKLCQNTQTKYPA